MNYTGIRAVPFVTPYRIMQPHLARYEFVIGEIPHAEYVLDVACGTGYGISIMKPRGYKNVYGVDLDFSAVRFARDTYQTNSELGYVQADGNTLPFKSNTFDLITSFETFEHMLEPQKYLSEICRLIQPEGNLIISVPNAPMWAPFSKSPDLTKEYIKSGLGHKHDFTADQFLKILADHFKTITPYGQDYRKKSYLSKIFRQLERMVTLIAYKAAEIRFIRKVFKFFLKDVLPQENTIFSDKKWIVKPWNDTAREPLFCIAICKDKKR